MDYEYEIYLEPNHPHRLKDIEGALEGFKIERSEQKLALLFNNDWKIWISLVEGEAVTEQASDLARYHNKPLIVKSRQKIDFTADADDEDQHHADHWQALEALSKLSGMHIYDPLKDEFPYEKKCVYNVASEMELAFLDQIGAEHADAVQSLKENPYNVWLWESLEEEMEDDGNLEFQLHCLHNVLTMIPWDYVSWFNSGIIYRDMGKYGKAEPFFRKTTELEPQFSDAWADLARIYFRKGKTEEALQYIDKAIEARSDNDIPYVNAGYYLIKLGDPEKSLEYSEAGIQYDAYCCTFNKAHALLALGRKAEAVDFYRQSLDAADSKQAFKSDFKADFEIFKKYDLAKTVYEALLPEIVG